MDLSLFKQFSMMSHSIPACAIGGINAQNIAQIKEAQMVACISGIWRGDIVQNVQNLIKNWNC